MSIFCRKKCKSQSTNPGNGKPSCQKAKSAIYLRENFHEPRNPFQKTRKGWILKKLVPKLKKLELNSTNLKLNCKKSHLDSTKKPDPSASSGLKVKNKTMRVLLDSGLYRNLLFVKKGSIKHIFVAKRAGPQSRGPSNSTFNTDKVGDI
jgi:hypothetical protein